MARLTATSSGAWKTFSLSCKAISQCLCPSRNLFYTHSPKRGVAGEKAGFLGQKEEGDDLQLRHNKDILPRDAAFANCLADFSLSLAVTVA